MNSFTIPYLNNWTNQYNQRQKPTLNDMLGYLQAVIQSDPPVETGFGGGPAMGNYYPP